MEKLSDIIPYVGKEVKYLDRNDKWVRASVIRYRREYTSRYPQGFESVVIQWFGKYQIYRYRIIKPHRIRLPSEG